LTVSPGREIEDVWEGRQLVPGEGGEERLREWLGWKRGVDYEVEDGVWVSREKARL
jgi:alpha-methylacyl-CoA racemase